MGTDFDSGLDPVVRVDARRLRDKLREYYADAPADEVVISLPKGSYVPVFEWSKAANAPAEAPPATKTPAIWVVLCVVLGLSSTLLYFPRNTRVAEPELRPLVSLPGVKLWGPSLSPDGNFVAFNWTGPPEKPEPGVYIKPVEGEAVRRLTRGQQPAWSPDGRELAVARLMRPDRGGGVFIVSQLGGSERRVSNSGNNVAWTPDGAALLIRDQESEHEPYAIFSISLKTLEKRRLTRPEKPIGDWRAAVSPDGATLAFIRAGLPGLSDIYLQPMAGGEPRRLTNWNQQMWGLAWTPDGREIVYDVEEAAGSRLWRISARALSPGHGIRLAESTGDAQYPSISPPAPGRTERLAYRVKRETIGLRLIDLTHPQSPGALNRAAPFQPSSRIDWYGRISPDGSQVAFISNRDGAYEMWLSGLDGSNLHRLTRSNGGQPSFPAWSPDGQSIAFNSSQGGVGTKSIFVISASGGEPKQLNPASMLVGPPEWSGDGQWIYFMSDRSGTYQIWKMDRAGGNARQITRNGGFFARESPDGKYLYYTDGPPPAPGVRLMRVPVNGGEEIVLIPRVRPALWSVNQKGIYYLDLGPPTKSLMLFYPESGKVERVGDLPDQSARIQDGMDVSRDGRWLLLNYFDREDTDLMLIDNFR